MFIKKNFINQQQADQSYFQLKSIWSRFRTILVSFDFSFKNSSLKIVLPHLRFSLIPDECDCIMIFAMQNMHATQQQQQPVVVWQCIPIGCDRIHCILIEHNLYTVLYSILVYKALHRHSTVKISYKSNWHECCLQPGQSRVPVLLNL